MVLLFADLPPALHDRVVCSITAAIRYEVPANIVLAVAEKEAGRPGQWVRNGNGTHDVGSMQFNTAYLGDLARYGITASDVAAAGCYPFDLAAWRLRRHLCDDAGDLWTKAANYHSRTPRYNAVYRADLMARAARWADWLDARFVTRDMAKHGDSGRASTQAGAGAPSVASRATAKAPAPATEPGQGVAVLATGAAGYMPRRLVVHGKP